MKIFYTGYDIINGNQAVVSTKSLSFNGDKNYYERLKSVLTIKRAKDLALIRVGRMYDGGYIMIDNFSQGGGQV